MNLSQLLTPERIRVPFTATDKRGVIAELVDVLAGEGCIDDAPGVLKAVLQREDARSTGIGYGLAIPHVKSTACTSVVMAAGKPAQPIEYQSIDKKPVNFVVMLVSPPDQTGTHIQALAKLTSLMNNEAFRAAIQQAPTAADLHECIVRFETGAKA